MPSGRRQARILAMQALCQWDVQGEASSDQLETFFAAQGATGAAADYAGELVHGFEKRRKEIDLAIAGSAKRWKLDRISPPERNAMRVAIVELLTQTVPPKVALSEAIEIGREYGGAQSPRFINGVLDDAFKRLQGQSEDD